MSEETVLLKIKREFSKDESIALLLQKISSLEFEIGILKSELSEKDDYIFKLKQTNHELKQPPKTETKTKKQWEQEPLFQKLSIQLKSHEANNKKQTKNLKNGEINFLAYLL